MSSPVSAPTCRTDRDSGDPSTGVNAWTDVLAEGGGAGALVAAVVGSGIMAQRLCGGNPGLELLANSLATGAVLVALITALGPVSGAHLNPAVTLFEALRGRVSPRRAACMALSQFAGGLLGTVVSHVMFGLPAVSATVAVRTGPGVWLGELLATLGLLAVIRGTAGRAFEGVSLAVGCWIVAAYWFTSSTSFANPALTLARCFTASPPGIRWQDAPAFVVAQILAVLLALVLLPLVFSRPRT